MLEKVIFNQITDFWTAFHTLTANYGYSRSNKENLPLPI